MYIVHTINVEASVRTHAHDLNYREANASYAANCFCYGLTPTMPPTVRKLISRICTQAICTSTRTPCVKDELSKPPLS